MAAEVAATVRPGEGLHRRIAHVMVARLVLALLALALALVLLGAGREGGELAERGLYGTMVVAFAATLVGAALLPRVERQALLAAAGVAIDVAVVTALVLFSGGGDSIFGFLYLPVVVYGALLFGRRGAYGAAGAGSLGYGVAIVLSRWLEPTLALRGGLVPPPEMAVALWGVHSGALLLVALLSNVLVRELRLADERLVARTSDLERLRSLHDRTVESLTSGLLTLDGDGRITSFNPEAERITGRGRAEVLGLALDELLPGASDLLAGRHEAPAAGRGRRRLSFRNARGEERFLGLAASNLRDRRGGEPGRVLIFQDVTEVVAMERELTRSERLAGVGQLAADMAHEIRNPLAAISGSVEMLRAGLGGDERDHERRRLMDIVLREIDRLDALITDFLQYARPAPPKSEPVELAPLLEEMAEICRTALPEGITLATEVPRGLTVRVDATQLRQALWNLLSNAQQAVGSGGTIRLTARPRPRPQGSRREGRKRGAEGSLGVEIGVSDDGAGIASEHLERIFDPFFTTKTGGTGLGLATVHRIVEGHGGTLEVRSEVGRGTAFRLWLPRAEEGS